MPANTLAVPAYTDAQIKTRIELNQRAGYGLEKASQATLNIIFLLCQRWHLDPVTDITLFEGRPFITIDGRLRLLRSHPDYRGYSCRPLSRADKESWGYDADDIVVECTIRTVSWGDISARGKVTAEEVRAARARANETSRRPAPIAMHPVEIAEKRAIARAERAAFGQDSVLDDEQVENAVHTVIEERHDPERIARDSATYQQIYQPDGQDSAYDQPDIQGAAPNPAAVVEAAVEVPSPSSAATSDPPTDEWARRRDLESQAIELGLTVPTLDGRTSKKAVKEANDQLDGVLRAHEAGLQLTDDAQSAF